MGDQEFEYAKRWAPSVARAGAIDFVIAEHNHSFNAAAKDALDFHHSDWRGKSVGLESAVAPPPTRASAGAEADTGRPQVGRRRRVTIPLVVVRATHGTFSGGDVLNAGAWNLLDGWAALAPALREFRNQPGYGHAASL